MRRIEEQMKEIGRRAERIGRKKARRRLVAVQAGAVAVCLAAIVGASYGMQRLSVRDVMAVSGGYGSIIAFRASAPYIVIGALAFVLGILVTALCIHLQKGQEDKEKP